MKALLKTLLIALTMFFFLVAGFQTGNSMSSIASDPHNGWYCDGDDETGECEKNPNVTCCNNFIDGGCEDVSCDSNPGHSG